MYTVFKPQNCYAKQGILRRKNTPLLFKDKNFPEQYFNQYFTLLNRFEIALPLDKDYKRILIPSMLPEKRPDIVAKQQLNDKKVLQMFYLVSFQFDQGQAYHCPAPPGFWSHLLSRIMSKFQLKRNTWLLPQIFYTCLLPQVCLVVSLNSLKTHWILSKRMA